MRLSLPSALRTLPGLTLCVITVGGGGIFALMQSQAPAHHSSNTLSLQDWPKPVIPSSAPTEAPRQLSAVSASQASAPALLATYAASPGLEAYASRTRVVLFFTAPWCNTCQATQNELTRRLSELPAGLAVVSVDFDQNQPLRDTYQVSTPDTFVQIDSEQQTLARWNGGGVQALLGNLQAAR